MKIQRLQIAIIFTAVSLTACDAQTQPAKVPNAKETRNSIDLGTAEPLNELTTNWFQFWAKTSLAVTPEIPKQNSPDGRVLFVAIVTVSDTQYLATVSFIEQERLAALVTESAKKTEAAQILFKSYSGFNDVIASNMKLLNEVIASPACPPAMTEIVKKQAIEPLKLFKKFTNARADQLKKIVNAADNQ